MLVHGKENLWWVQDLGAELLGFYKFRLHGFGSYIRFIFFFFLFYPHRHSYCHPF